MTDWRRLRYGLSAFAAVVVIGTIGYVALGFSALDALYQTVTTVTTVGFREVRPLSDTGQVFTIVLILLGVGTALYTLSVLIETLVEGQLRGVFGRRRMERRIARLRGHVVVCGWGRVGHAIARDLATGGRELVVIDQDPTRLDDVGYAWVLGDATEDAVLERAGIRQASSVVAALDADAANLVVTLSARNLAPELFIVARVRLDDNEEKLRRAGADRVVNPQSIGGARMAAFVLQPHVTEFLDVVMHDQDIEFRLEEIVVTGGSPLAGRSIHDARIRERTGALVLAVRGLDGAFVTNPEPGHRIAEQEVVIAIGTQPELDELRKVAAPTAG